MNKINPEDLRIIKGLPPIAVKGDRVAFDTEWFGMDKKRLHRPHGRFAFLGCTFDGITVYWIDNTELISNFLSNIDKAVWIGQNFKFDITQLRRFAHIPQRKLLWDTLLIEQIMWSGYYQDFGLNDLARRYLDVYMPKEVRSEFSENDTASMTNEQLEYAAADVVATWRIYQAQRAIIDETDLEIWKNIELPFLWTLLSMGGIKLDQEKWLALAKKNGDAAEIIRQKYPSINLNSPKQVKEYFKSQYNITAKSTDVEFLEAHPDNEFAQDMLNYRNYSKRASTYGEKFIEDYVEADGKIYADIYQCGAECMPAGQNVLTNRGYLPVELVRIGDLVITHLGRVRPVINTSIHSPTPIYKVRLYNGLILRTTGNHPYLTKAGWKSAKDLQIGDVIVYHSRKEVWKKIQDWEDYLISSWGRVFSKKSRTFLSFQPKGKWGHLKVTLVRNASRVRGNDRKDFLVHRLVADAFISGKSSINKEVRHLNGIAWDNTDGNLCWGTSLENKQDAIKHGTMCHRYTSSQSKVTDVMVSEIRNGDNYRGRDGVLANKFGISRRHIWDIRNNVRWQELPKREKKVEFGYTFVEEVIEEPDEVTYGLEIQDDHSHVTEGIVTHNTGRTSCRAPNLQNQPHEFDYRDCFIAEDGNCMVVADWGSQEPRIAAYLSQDERLIAALNGKEKLYIAVARDVLGKTITKDSPEYTHIKSTVLGIFYGMSAKGLAKRLNMTDDDEMNESLARGMINAFLDAYPGVKGYMERQSHAQEYVQSIYGRKIWLNKYSYQWERNALNAPIQSSAADAMKLAAPRFVNEWGLDFEGRSPLRLLVHDEIALEVPEDDCEKAMKLLEKCMVEVSEEMHEGICGVAEVYSGASWSCKH